MNLVLLATMVFVPMLIEAVVSARNERRLRAAGAVEPAGDVYTAMQIAYPVAFLAMLIEGAMRLPYIAEPLAVAPADVLVAGGFTIFIGAKLLKYWAILTLGTRWTFRVLVPPGSTMILAGPYRLLRHPNYLAVIGELLGAALVARAPITGAIAVIGFAVLVLLRIRIEERALGVRPSR